MANQSNEVLTIGEAIEVVRRLDERRGLGISARQLRYWDITLGLCTGRATDRRNGARTLTKTDIAIARLVRRLQRDGVPWRAIWALLRHQGDQLRDSCRRSTLKVLWMEPNGLGHFLTPGEAAIRPPRECYLLANVVRGVEETVRLLRSGDYALWNGAKAVRVEELDAEIASAVRY